jgi:hypothetical protein
VSLCRGDSTPDAISKMISSMKSDLVRSDQVRSER